MDDGMELDQIVALISGIGSALVVAGIIFLGLKKWIHKVANDTELISKRTKTANGHTLAQITESTEEKVDKLLVTSETNRGSIDNIFVLLREHLEFGGHHRHSEESSNG